MLVSFNPSVKVKMMLRNSLILFKCRLFDGTKFEE